MGPEGNSDEEFEKRKSAAWNRATPYWLEGPLRHVVDVGDVIARDVLHICEQAAIERPMIVDMGFGDGWLIERLLKSERSFEYIGIDSNLQFIEAAQERYKGLRNVKVVPADLAKPIDLECAATVVVNAFNFFEILDLGAAFRNVRRWLAPGGWLYMATIDRTFLVLALSGSERNFIERLRAASARGTLHWDFQKIDTGSELHKELEYPSVLHRLEDFIKNAHSVGLQCVDYREYDYTHRAIPKIYQHLVFRATRRHADDVDVF